MQSLLGRRRTLRHDSPTQIIPRSIVVSTPAGPDPSESRYEPETFGACTVPVDAYAAWMQQREADRERADPPVRWVVRPRDAAVPANEASARLTTV
jgi:hypothetical protein